MCVCCVLVCVCACTCENQKLALSIVLCGFPPSFLRWTSQSMELTVSAAGCPGSFWALTSLHLAPALQVLRLSTQAQKRQHPLSLPSGPFKSIQRSFSHYESRNWGHRMEENHFRMAGCVYAREKQKGQAEGRLKNTEHPRDMGPWLCHREEVTQNPWLSILMAVWSHHSEFWWYNERNLRPIAHVVQRSTGSLTC